MSLAAVTKEDMTWPGDSTASSRTMAIQFRVLSTGVEMRIKELVVGGILDGRTMLRTAGQSVSVPASQRVNIHAGAQLPQGNGVRDFRTDFDSYDCHQGLAGPRDDALGMEFVVATR